MLVPKRTLLIMFMILLAAPAMRAQQNVYVPQKFALVIGNSNYNGISGLRNPVNDANDMEDALEGLGFTVEKVIDGNLEQMETAVLNLRKRLGGSRNTYGFFFYAGHGVQSGGENYLIPVEANNIRSETQLRDRAVSLQFILDSLSEAGNELNMFVLDACRDNPFGWARSGIRGLSTASHAPTGSIVMYATSPNSSASDGTGRNGLFTGYLLNNLKTQGLSVFEVFDKTMGDVIEVTNGTQQPELSLRFPGAARAYLGSSIPVQSLPSPAPVPVQSAATREPAAGALEGRGSPPERSAPENFAYINGGTFTMGSPSNEPGRYDGEGPQRQITISPFRMGRFEVTQREYQDVMGTNPSVFKGDTLPVENVSWFDAIEYCNRRSQKEGLVPAYTRNGDTVTWDRKASGYRLPTEAEWEYACRAGTTTPFSTGNNITTNQANYDGNYPYNNNALGLYRELTTPAGSFAANPWGLHDMHGNVWEWCWDWHGSYTSGAQTDPAGALTGARRVVRGGSWDVSGSGLRSAYRDSTTPSRKNSSIGFRVIRG